MAQQGRTESIYPYMTG